MATKWPRNELFRNRQMAKPVKLKSGRWRIRPILANGTRISKTYPSKDQADKALKRIEAMVADGIDPTQKARDDQAQAKARAITFREFADEIRESRRSSSGDPLAETYKIQLKRYVNLADFADKPIGEITATDVTTWFNGLSSRTANQASKAYTWIKSVFAEAIDRKLIADNPCRIKSAGRHKSQAELTIPSVEQMRIMYELAQGDIKTYLALAAGGGLRRGEIHELRKKNIQTETIGNRQITFVEIKKATQRVSGQEARQGKTKTSGSVRRIPLAPIDGQIVRDHVAAMNSIDPEALLFCSDRKTNAYWSHHYGYNKLKRIFAEAGWDGSPHRLRAYAATQYGLTEATLPEIMERFGWTNVMTAMKYLHTTGREIELLDRLAR
jgi:integrase